MQARSFAAGLVMPVLAAAMMTGCFSDDSVFSESPDEGDGDGAVLRAIHATADAASLRVSVNDGAEEEELSYGGETGTLQVEPGEVTVAVSRATAPNDALLEVTLELEAEGSYSLVIHGSLNANDLHLSALREQAEPAAEDEARLHFLNAIHVDGQDWQVDLEANSEALVTEAGHGVWQVPVTLPADGETGYALEARNQDGTVVTNTPTNFTPSGATAYLIIAAGVWGDGVVDTDPEILVISGFEE